MNGEAFLSLLQFSDGLFPVGLVCPFLRSRNLRRRWNDSRRRRRRALPACPTCEGSVAPTDADRGARFAESGAVRVGLREWNSASRIDRCLDAMKPASELRDASRQMGRQVLRIAANLGEPFALQGLTAELFRAVENGGDAGASRDGIRRGRRGPRMAGDGNGLRVSLFHLRRTGRCCIAAVAAGPVGRTANSVGAGAVHRAGLREEAQGKDMADIWSFAPGLEIAAMRHAMLDARLFRS